ncbi:Colicin V production protein [Denitrovibrio acetiphilus DSM 12809]|uniref:Colicin V production protein n=1 Tax=Denitrovibrio acetiphilus (strain DSM 12809 / NBRC 114555 / N2460) TaxID=522772 RepID=D4H7C9_DENA2|nr:CvpA family protein [Denitrovibrio acetiphilus]ADD67928.1 Colicin V production protein [Denitrovibrio acetiphilus DSM 12809]
MGIIDIVLLIIIGVFAVKGLIKGLVMEIFGLIALVAGYIAGFKYSHVFSNPISALGLNEKASDALGYVVGFLLAYIIVVLIGNILSKAFKEIKLGAVNRGGGFFFGGIKSAVILGLILSAVITVAPKDAAFTKNLQSGVVSGSLAKVAPFVYKVMNKIPDVKKINPFDIPEIPKSRDALDMLEDDALKDALDAVKNSKAVEEIRDLPENTKDTIKGLTEEKPLEDPLGDMQKD